MKKSFLKRCSTFIIFSVFLTSIFGWGNVTKAAEVNYYRNIAYFTSWSGYARAVEVGDVDPTLLTHINFAFANLLSDGTVAVGDSWIDTDKPFGDDTWDTPLRGNFGALNKLKKENPKLKTLISIGGWTWSGAFSDVAASDLTRKKCAQSAVDFAVKYGFDGVDLDWEFPVEGGNGIKHRPEDGDNYVLLLKEIRQALDEQGKKDGKDYLLSIAGGPNPSFTKNCKMENMMKYLDYVNVMSYDYSGAWSAQTNHLAPLYANSKDPSGNTLCVSDTIEAYINSGVEPKDLNMGLAFYGRGWTNVNSNSTGLFETGSAPVGTGLGNGTWEAGSFDYWDIAGNYLNKQGYTRYWDNEAKVPYLYNGKSFITYDDEESIKYKMEYLKNKGLGGAMFWEFSGDKNYDLQKVVAESLQINKGGTGEVIPPVDEETPEPEVPGDTPDSGDNVAAWNATSIYVKGDSVTYNGNTYEAKWWTQNEKPGANEWGPWQQI